MFKALIFVLYVDPEDKEAYQQVLRNMVEIRKQYPLDLKIKEGGDFAIDRTKNILFVISTTPNLMFF